MKIVVSKRLVPNGYRAITLYPFIFVRDEIDKKDRVLINHENIHIAQQKELLVIGFYLLYALDFGLKYLRFRNWDAAYRNLFFEREAYANESNLNYLKTRVRFAFLGYVGCK